MYNIVVKYTNFVAKYPAILTTIFFREGLAYFSKTMSNRILHVLQQYGSVEDYSPGVKQSSIHNIW